MSARDVLPSPNATGGSGADYEKHVGAAYLVVLLVGGMTPFSSESALTTIHFQARHLGWMTDDFLLVGEGPSGTRHIAVQAKRTFTLAISDDECVNTLQAAWDDFKNVEQFDAKQDRLALVTGQAPTNFTRGMRSLLDAAIASLSAADLTRRLALTGHLSKEAKHCYDTVVRIIRAYAGDSVTETDIWTFLRIWDFSVLDFHASSSTAEALVKSLLAAAEKGPATQANETWDALLRLAGEDAGRARSFTSVDLPVELRDRYQMPTAAARDALEQVRLVSGVVRASVSDRLANTATLSRHDVVADGIALLNDVDALIITGPAGSGKSVVAQKLFDVLTTATLGLAFRSETLASPHLATSALQLGLRLRPLAHLFALHERKLLWVESGERLFEKDAPGREAFGDLLRMLASHRPWKLLVTCRDHSADRFRTAFLDRTGCAAPCLRFRNSPTPNSRMLRPQYRSCASPCRSQASERYCEIHSTSILRHAWPGLKVPPTRSRAVHSVQKHGVRSSDDR